jgi:2-polyprenyl-3-methyl-5-hydroxy-6-metoxy-1,4-benzoquinol methylase
MMSIWCAKGGQAHWRCPQCGLITVPAAAGEDVSGVYVGEHSVFFRDGNENYYLDDTNELNAGEKLAWVSEYLAPGASLCDVGAGFGYFVAAAQARFLASGLDISPEAVRWSQTTLGVSNRVGTIYDLSGGHEPPLDAVTAWDIIEHLADPLSALASIHRALARGGMLFLSTPDAGSLVARLMGRRWHYLDPVQHRTLFSRANLARALASSGFDVVAVRTFGRLYRLQYVFDRLTYLHAGGPIGTSVSAGRRLLGRQLRRVVRINLRDVVAIAARKRE